MIPFVLQIYDFFALHGGFLYITSFIGMLHELFFQEFKSSWSYGCVCQIS